MLNVYTSLQYDLIFLILVKLSYIKRYFNHNSYKTNTELGLRNQLIAVFILTSCVSRQPSRYISVLESIITKVYFRCFIIKS